MRLLSSISYPFILLSSRDSDRRSGRACFAGGWSNRCHHISSSSQSPECCQATCHTTTRHQHQDHDQTSIDNELQIAKGQQILLESDQGHRSDDWTNQRSHASY